MMMAMSRFVPRHGLDTRLGRELLVSWASTLDHLRPEGFKTTNSDHCISGHELGHSIMLTMLSTNLRLAN